MQPVMENVVNLSKDSHSTSSNHKMSTNSTQSKFKEEETMHQLKDDMNIG